MHGDAKLSPEPALVGEKAGVRGSKLFSPVSRLDSEIKA
jgi:hypothetical protein